MLDLDRRGRDVRHASSTRSRRWLIDTLGDLGVSAHVAPGRVGIWVDRPEGEAKVGAIGVRVRRWVTMHGFSINIDPDLNHFAGIVPCGLPDFGVTSLARLGTVSDMKQFDGALRNRFDSFLSALVNVQQRS